MERTSRAAVASAGRDDSCFLQNSSGSSFIVPRVFQHQYGKGSIRIRLTTLKISLNLISLTLTLIPVQHCRKFWTCSRYSWISWWTRTLRYSDLVRSDIVIETSPVSLAPFIPIFRPFRLREVIELMRWGKDCADCLEMTMGFCCPSIVVW